MLEEVKLFFVIKNKTVTQLDGQNCKLIFNFTGHHATPNDMNLGFKKGEIDHKVIYQFLCKVLRLRLLI
jgi:hypothetical protein